MPDYLRSTGGRGLVLDDPCAGQRLQWNPHLLRDGHSSRSSNRQHRIGHRVQPKHSPCRR